ncbi:hypothetical protein AOQ73_12120 [Bradyrhizobium pachyrhizi]|uniref:ATP-binding protein n=1 Tax=Bradyrhizobium pachyrhizi TaxID=280333 RepID=UPI000704C828|nr:ATP-binding protein [Bradyrhizobium pachyrhizi]KRQ07647.1 hypothetical protein AOQ73_12120 [Bradyrhizobium pachyrhizi]
MTSENETTAVRARIDVAKAKAALVGAFDPFELIERGLDEDTEMMLLNALAKDIDEIVLGQKTLWRLSANARHRELPKAIARADFGTLLAAARPLPDDRFAQHLVRLLKGQRLADYAKLSPPELLDVAVAQDFVNHANGAPGPAGAADPRWVLARLDERQRLDHVAPKLIGRKPQLSALRAYAQNAEIAPPLSPLAEPALEPGKLPWLRPVLVTGIGGSGKSALIAETVKTLRKDDWSGPITVLLDFDEPNLSLGGEREWTAELTRQIGRARAELDGEMDGLRRSMVQDARRPDGELKAVDVAMLSLANVLSSRRKRHHLVIVIDTFEEVLVQCDMRRPEDVTVGEHDTMLELTPFGLLLGWLDTIKSLKGPGGVPAFASVRAIVAGRAAPFSDEEERLGSWFSAKMEVAAFSPAEAAEFLKLRRPSAKVLSDARIKKIASISDAAWYPLLLLILILYARGRSAKEIDALIDDVDGSDLYRSEFAIAALYSRFLDRIKDHEVSLKGGTRRRVSAQEIRRLAHPGLALRSVTPTLIREVLAEPCGLGDIDEEKARQLFSALAKEIWLVEQVGKEEACHVKNLRRVMLPMLRNDNRRRQDDPSGRSLKEIVREVQARAADWFGRQGSSNRRNVLLEAYYRAFLGETGMLASDPLLRHEVSLLAGEDVHAMPIEASSLLMQGNLSQEARAALPEPLRRKAESDLRARKTRSSVVHASRTRLPDEEEEEEEEEEFQEVPIAPRGRSLKTLENRDLGSRVGDLFNRADFSGIVRLARRRLSYLRVDDVPPSELSISGITGHWIWKWALANLAAGRSDDVVSTWMLDEVREFALRKNASVLMAAVATVALGGTAWASPGRVRRLDVLPPQRLDLDNMRLLGLGLVAPPKAIELPAILCQILSADSTYRLAVRPVILRQIAALRRSKQVSYLRMEKVINRRETARVVLRGEESETRRLVRGRSPELYGPIRAAMIDAARYEPQNFAQALERMRSQATVWPVELETKHLAGELQKTRRADFLLQRLIEVLDVLGLVGDMLETLGAKSALERVQRVAQLFALYDELLLEGMVEHPTQRRTT